MRLRLKIVALAFCGVMLFACGCDKTNAQTAAEVGGESFLVPPINSVIVVTLRSDVFGTLMTAPPQTSTSTTTGITAYGTNNVTGTLTQINNSWMVVSTTAQDYWIPMNLVVMVQVPRR